jgi:hypothetical protein
MDGERFIVFAVVVIRVGDQGGHHKFEFLQ